MRLESAVLAVLASLTMPVLLLGPAGVQAQTFPSKPIVWVVPYPPGGITDTTSRIVAKRMGEELGQSVVVDNRPGASGMIGTEQVKRAAPDGYTVLYGTQGTMAALVTLQKKIIRYQPLVDFVPVHALFTSPPVVAVSSDRPYKTLKDLTEFAARNPGKLNYGSAGIGTNTHLSVEIFQTVTGTKMTHVAYKGSAAAINDLLGGAIDLVFDYAIAINPHVRSGKMRALATTGKTRLPSLPDVPTVIELGLPAAESASWSGIFVPAGTPPDVVQRLSKALAVALADPAIVNPIEQNGSVPLRGLSEDKFRAFVAEEIVKWAEVIRLSGASVD